MKKLIIGLLVLAASLSAGDLSGIWNGKGGEESAKYGLVPMTAQMTLLQARANVTGTFKIGNGAPWKITNAIISGNTLTFAVSNPNVIGTGTLTLNSSGQLVGKLTSSAGKVFDLAFTHQ